MIKVTIYERYIENVGDIRGYLRKFANSSNVIIKENIIILLIWIRFVSMHIKKFAI